MSLPKRFPDREAIAAVRDEAEQLEPGAEGEVEHRLAGRVMARRDLGKLMFLDLVDRSGRIQLLVRPDDVGAVSLDLGDVVGVVGVAAKSRRGEPSLAVRSLELLAKIHSPLPDTFHGITDVELRIADELYLKRLIVGGLEKVYELAKDFRNEGVSYKHSPEFTQVEWYEAYADYRDTMERTETLVERAAQAAIGRTKVTFRGHEVELAKPWRRVKFIEALDGKGAWSRDPGELRAKLQEEGVDTTHDKTWAQLVDHAYSQFVEPELIQPTI